ncbi:putative sporulation transcription regulator WhiA [Polycladomyces abyssicola]|uniref:Probable cell division protein WhiA n=1 Tax=Polycladomyces abyssicola TaxID=1125966 RepID=A0A8D5ZM21_9BACL|nr:DNA-binding protein WhiA [Polycladomyces abyssicola]BCU83114.1 putative sporulation transcription regulator WhiA [Polycladomyces abyssicola]
MSFTSATKKELTRIESDTCCQRAELSALARMNGVMQIARQRIVLDITTENAAIARRTYALIKDLYQLQAEVLVRKKVRLKKNNVYLVRLSVRAEEILRDLRILGEGFERVKGIAPDLIEKNCCKRAYLRGAFLAGGSVNNPDSGSYHLEIISTYHDHSEALCRLMNRFRLHAKIIERKKGFVVYIKEGDKIGELLNIIGAHQSLLRFEDVRIMKDMRNSVNRLVNCETANLNKTIQAAMRQIDNIQLIDREIGLNNLPQRLREIAEVRLQHPDITLTELGQMLPGGKVSKSAVNHRLRKLDEIADRLRRKTSGE